MAAIPPLLVWCGLYLYLTRIEKKVREAERRLSPENGSK
jgi:hypothetical protein